jgi:putative nucleotide binding protein
VSGIEGLVDMEQQRKREEYGIILDFLQHGYPFDKRPSHLKTPIAQALGTTKFALLELVPKKDIHMQPFEKVYIGDDDRDKVHHVNGRIGIGRLTQTARSELQHAVKALVDERESEFIEFFNKAQPLSTRMHALELLPGVGKKHMWEIIEQRKEEAFANFDDIQKRVKLLSDPKKVVIKRILSEIEGKEKHNLFVK